MVGTVNSKSTNSYRTELYAIAEVFHKSVGWATPLWITFDNEAVVKDANKVIARIALGIRHENQGLWEIIEDQLSR